MSKIRIKNFGPIKEGYHENNGWMDIKKVTVFIGDQGSGKSTVAKLIATCIWLEKAKNRGDLDRVATNFNWFEHRCLMYQGIKNYILPNMEIEYIGNLYRIIIIRNEPLKFDEIKDRNYIVPKIMYVPSERNILSTIKSAYDVTGLPDALSTFGEEVKKANIELKGEILKLPFKKFSYTYKEDIDVSYVIGEGYQINLLEASSGLQSTIPLFIVSRNLANSILYADDDSNPNISVNQLIRRNNELANIVMDKSIAKENLNIELNKVYARYHNKSFINIVEEPEQNLFPTSQRAILNSLVEFNNMSTGNKLIITTHSPYLINYITLAIKAFKVRQKLSDEKKDSDSKINEIVNIKSLIKPEDLIIYQLNELDGTISKLADYKGLPSDENFLNDQLSETNQFFAQLQEIEKGWQ